MIAVATYGILGRPVGLPQPTGACDPDDARPVAGLLVSPEMVHNLSAYPMTIALLALATFCATFGSSIYLQRVHGWDRTSALLAGSPGALSQIIMLATERNADVPGIAVVQIFRVIILTGMVPLLLAATGLMGHGALPSRGEASPLALAELAAAAVAVSLFMRWIKFPASWMFGAMMASSVLHGTGWVRHPPQWAYITARRHRQPDRLALRQDPSTYYSQPCLGGAWLVHGCHRDLVGVRDDHRADHDRS